MEYQIKLQTVVSQTIAVVRLRAQLSELSTVVPRACGEVWEFVRAHGIPQPGRGLAVYLDEEINLEVGAEVGAPFAGDERVICSQTPEGSVAMATHIGPYHFLGEAHMAIRCWCSAQGHALAGPNWEIYDHWSDDPAKLRTDVYYLLRKGG